MQIDVDIGSSSVARSIIGLVLGYVTSLVVDLAILIEVCNFLSVENSSVVFACFSCQNKHKTRTINYGSIIVYVMQDF